MSLWVLDTDHLTLLLQGHPNVVRRVASVHPAEIRVTIVTIEEQLRGRLNTIRQSSATTSQLSELVKAYEKLELTVERFKVLNLLSFDSSASGHFQNLLRQKVRIGTRDLRIAAIALSINGTVVTRNRRDFEKVPGLQIVDWTIDL